MTDNLTIWNALGKTDPAHTKGFNRAGGFKGTAVKPMWTLKRLTEHFGPAGVGWGVFEPRFELVHSQEGEVLVFCTVSAWHGKPQNVIWGVGGDKAVTKRNDGKMFHDDEAFKKAFTDAVGNAFKTIGVAADIHMGLFDDDKYVSSMREEFAPDTAPKLSDAQREETMLLLESTGVPVAEYLANGGWKDLREVPAEQFELGKRWINRRAREIQAAKTKEPA